MDRINGWAVGFLLLAILFVALVIVAAVDLSNYADKNYRIGQAISNTNYCPSATTGNCQLTIDLTLAAPAFSFEYSREIALFQATLVAAIEYPTDNGIVPPHSVGYNANILYDGIVIGTVCSSLGIIWISFRGTSTQNEWNHDLAFNQVGSPFAVQESIPRRFATTVMNSIKPVVQPQQVESYMFMGLVHKGWMEIYTLIRSQIEEAVGKLDTSASIVVGGHSLGASLATLFCADPAFKSRNVVGVTFGGPRVGNSTFVMQSVAPTKIYRVANNADIICDLPTSVTPNFTSGAASDVFLYTHAGTIVPFEDNRGALILNHAISAYLTFLSA